VRATRLARVLPLRRALERYADYQVPGARTSAIARTRFIDDALVAAIEAGCKQVVILGAGYDCRAHRIPALRAVEVFEVDRAKTQAVKRARIGAREVHGALRYVAVDFAVDDLETSLTAAGWRLDEPTAFVWEGVTNYLSDAAVSKVLSMVGKSATSGRLIFTYIHRGVLDGSVQFAGGERARERVKRMGEPWTFGLDPLETESYLRRFGLALDEDVGADSYRARYALESNGYAFYRIAVARVVRDT
jgi:methyltransferase (TIGR00027 family)